MSGLKHVLTVSGLGFNSCLRIAWTLGLRVSTSGLRALGLGFDLNPEP